MLRRGKGQQRAGVVFFTRHDALTMIVEGTLEGPVKRHWIEIHDADGTNVATLPLARVTSLN
jgi:hypothetical protein